MGLSENFEAIFLNGKFHGVVLGLGVPQLVARKLVRIFMTFNNVNIRLIGESKTTVFAIAASFLRKVNEQIGLVMVAAFRMIRLPLGRDVCGCDMRGVVNPKVFMYVLSCLLFVVYDVSCALLQVGIRPFRSVFSSCFGAF